MPWSTVGFVGGIFPGGVTPSGDLFTGIPGQRFFSGRLIAPGSHIRPVWRFDRALARFGESSRHFGPVGNNQGGGSYKKEEEKGIFTRAGITRGVPQRGFLNPR